MEGNETSEYWEFFDRVYCISLVNRTDRRAEAQKQFEKVGLQDKVEFVKREFMIPTLPVSARGFRPVRREFSSSKTIFFSIGLTRPRSAGA